ncbi:MAG: hypothetical protein WAM06_14455, partial [Methyloceanibacter sp.]
CHDDLYWPSSIEVEPSVKQEATGAEMQRFLGWGLMRRSHTKKGVLLNRAMLRITPTSESLFSVSRSPPGRVALETLVKRAWLLLTEMLPTPLEGH